MIFSSLRRKTGRRKIPKPYMKNIQISIQTKQTFIPPSGLSSVKSSRHRSRGNRLRAFTPHTGTEQARKEIIPSRYAGTFRGESGDHCEQQSSSGPGAFIGANQKEKSERRAGRNHASYRKRPEAGAIQPETQARGKSKSRSRHRIDQDGGPEVSPESCEQFRNIGTERTNGPP